MQPSGNVSTSSDGKGQAIKFKSDIATKVFDRLVDFFIEDYMAKKYVAEKSGWRTLVEIASKARISTSALYGKHSTINPALNEPVRRGLIETRIFPGERGRGGEIMRLRIAYDREPVKEFVNKKIMFGRNAPKTLTELDVTARELLSPQTISLSKERIAVLPFANMSGDSRDEYFSDGITQELISTLSKISGLKVIARTSVMAYKEEKKKVDEIAKELGVGTILEGSVRKSGDKLRIGAQLIDGRDGNHIWSETYARDLKDVFAIQSEISETVARELKVRLLDQEKDRIRKEPSKNAEAYEFYFRGLQYSASSWGTPNFGKKAIECFENAIKLDPNFSLAYCELAHVYSSDLDDTLGMGYENSILKAKELTLKALEIDPDLAEAHVSLGNIVWLLQRNREGWLSEEREYKRATELNPNYAYGHGIYGYHLLQDGKFDEAIVQVKKALELDPLSSKSYQYRVWIGWVLWQIRKFDEALEFFRRLLQLYPERAATAHENLGRTFLLQAKYDDALAEFHKAIELSDQVPGGKPYYLSELGVTYAKKEKREDVKRVTDELEAISKTTGRPVCTFLARIYTALGDKDEAVRLVEKANEQNEVWPFLRIKIDPIFDELHSDPRFISLLKRIGLLSPEEQRV